MIDRGTSQAKNEPISFSALFLQEAHPQNSNQPEGNTIHDTDTSTSYDGIVKNDVADDEDVDDGSLPDQTGLLTDSDAQEDKEIEWLM